MFLSIAYTGFLILYMSFFCATYYFGITFSIFISEFGTPFLSFSRSAFFSILLFVVGSNPSNISWNFNFMSRSSCVSSIPSFLASFSLLSFSVSIIWQWLISGTGIVSTWFTWFTASIWSSCPGLAATWFAFFTVSLWSCSSNRFNSALSFDSQALHCYR